MNYNFYAAQIGLGNLPADFDQWDMAGMGGWTLAHCAANRRRNRLPVTFDQWGLTDDSGLSVLKYLLSNKADYISAALVGWAEKKPLCREDVDWEVFKKELPEIYQKYTVDEAFDDEVNAVQQVHLL
jgi:hypothetical protein